MGFVLVIDWAIEGNGRSGRDAGKAARFGENAGLSVGEGEGVGLSGEERKVANGEVGEWARVLDTIGSW